MNKQLTIQMKEVLKTIFSGNCRGIDKTAPGIFKHLIARITETNSQRATQILFLLR